MRKHTAQKKLIDDSLRHMNFDAQRKPAYRRGDRVKFAYGRVVYTVEFVLDLGTGLYRYNYLLRSTRSGRARNAFQHELVGVER